MSQDAVVTIVREALKAIILTSMPPLIMGLLTGLAVSIFQTITSINEQTLAFVPKILAVFLAIMIFGAFMLNTLQELFINLYSGMAAFLK